MSAHGRTFARRVLTGVLLPAGTGALCLASAGALLVVGGGTPVLAQTPPPPCSTALKGRLVSIDLQARTMTVDLTTRREVFPVTEAMAQRLREARPGDGVTIDMDCRVRPAIAVGVRVDRRQAPDAGQAPSATPGRPGTTVLVSSDAACSLSVDFKPVATLAAGGRTELKLAPGEHLLEASTPDGRSWKEKVKVGGDQIIVEVKLGAPAATPAVYDAQAARACGALGALRAAGRELEASLRSSGFKFHKADSAAVSTAAVTWTRELEALRALGTPAERARVTADLSRVDADVREYADLLVKALETAQKDNTIMGGATTLRGKAQARREQIKLPPETLTLAPLCGDAPPATAR